MVCSEVARRRRYSAGWLAERRTIKTDERNLVHDDDDDDDEDGDDAGEAPQPEAKRARLSVQGDVDDVAWAQSFADMMFKGTPHGLTAKVYLQAPDAMVVKWIEDEAQKKGYTQLSASIDCAAVISAASFQRLVAYRNCLQVGRGRG